MLKTGIKYNNLTLYLLMGLQELIKENEELKNENKNLKSEIYKINDRLFEIEKKIANLF